MIYGVNRNSVPDVFDSKNVYNDKPVNKSAKQQNFDTANFSAALGKEQTKVKDMVGKISQQAHTRPTYQELDSIKSQVENGTYKPNSEDIAARMLLLVGEYA